MIGNSRLGLDLVGTKPLFGEQTIDHEVAERAGMTAGFPNPGMHNDRGFEPDHVFAQEGHGPPPGILDIAFEFSAERAVIPESVKATVDFGRLKNQALSFAQRNDFLHQFRGFRLGHKGQSFCEATRDVKGSRKSRKSRSIATIWWTAYLRLGCTNDDPLNETPE